MAWKNGHFGRLGSHRVNPVLVGQRLCQYRLVLLLLFINFLVGFAHKKSACNIRIALQQCFQKRIDRNVIDLLQLIHIHRLVLAGALEEALIPAGVHDFGNFVVLVEGGVQIVAHIEHHLLQIAGRIPLNIT
ncbi:hypothetical protein D3C75_807480 [compost metagenome]